MNRKQMEFAHNLVCHEIIYGSGEYEKCVNLRNKVLREPLGLTFSVEQMAAEAGDYHIACYKHDELVACLVLTPSESQRITMRQVAVDPDYHRQGIGRVLVQFCEAFARRKRFGAIGLHARETAVPFYVALGYHTVGERFEEITLPHWEMTKALEVGNESEV